MLSESKLTKIYQKLHQIPELALEEVKTKAYLQQEIAKLDQSYLEIKEISELPTALLVKVLGSDPKKTIGYRCDIDALPLTEETGLEFSSKNPGVMHACGHDGHMAALLGFAKKLKDKPLSLNVNILLIFQPAEESPGGAKLLVEAGILNKYNVKAIFGMHLMPTIDEGKIACRAGPLMAQNGELDVTVIGKSAHAGLYHFGVDSIVIASLIIGQYQNIISRVVSPVESCVINIGEIIGGTARNIVADKTVFRGTVRTYSEAVFKKITDTMQAINCGMERSYGCKIEFSCPPMYPPVLNDYGLYQQFVRIVNENYLELKEPLMLAEDFAFYQKEIPGIFFYLGTKTSQYSSGLHTEIFNFNENVLIKAVDVYYQLAAKIKLGE